MGAHPHGLLRHDGPRRRGKPGFANKTEIAASRWPANHRATCDLFDCQLRNRRREDKARGSKQSSGTRRHKYVDEGPRRAIVAQNTPGVPAAYIKMSVLPKRQTSRMAQASTAGTNKRAKILTRVFVITQHRIVIPIAEIKMTIRSQRHRG